MVCDDDFKVNSNTLCEKISHKRIMSRLILFFFIRNVFWEISINSLGAPFAKLRDSVYFMVDGVVVDANWTDLLIN